VIECLTDRVDLVVVSAARERKQLGFQFWEPRCVLGKVHLTRLKSMRAFTQSDMKTILGKMVRG
jgi:ABC-type proline/glycine betaine transport system substrate-binding protein